MRKESISLVKRHTVIAVIFTGAAVSRYNFQGEFDEALTISAETIDLSRIAGLIVRDNEN